MICTGAAYTGVAGPHLAGYEQPPVRRVRLQMLQTQPFGGRLTTSVADGDSLRYYPAFDLPGRRRLPPQEPAAASVRAQLLLVQRLDGSLTIGDTHEYHEPFAFDVDEDAYDHLRGRAEKLLGTALPPHPAALGRRVQPGHRHRALPQSPDRPGRDPGHRPGRPGHDLLASYRRGDVRLTPTPTPTPTPNSSASITVACLDMAGTTVADDGSVIAAFSAAVEQLGLPQGTPGYDEALAYVHQTMGQSKIEVFRHILGE